MRIQTFSFTDKTTGWELKPVSFNQLTLLVGASGVGKTRILRSILTLQNIAEGKSFSGIKWHIEFLSSNGNQYTWEGEFEKVTTSHRKISLRKNEAAEQAAIAYELVYRGDDLIVERNSDGIFLNKIKTVKLSNKLSVLYLLGEEEQIKEAAIEFKKIISHATGRDAFVNIYQHEVVNEIASNYRKLEEVRNAPLSLTEKLYFIYKRKKQLFNGIESSFTDIFPYVEQIRFESRVIANQSNAPGAVLLQIQMKERDTGGWISESEISSGMIKTLVHIAQLHLCADSSLILIDEFENSLGVNCIDELTSSILSSERGLQFIITSHHPYIINNINHKNWKIVTRKGSAVTAHDAAEFHFDKSKHKAFTQLINLDLYSEGVES